MGISAIDLKLRVIVPVLQHLGLCSISAVQLLLGTAAVESKMGKYLLQRGGNALGIYQIEPDTHQSIYDHYLKFRPHLLEKLEKLVAPYPQPLTEQLVTNLAYSTAIARLVYYQIPEALPEPYHIEGCAQYWKKYYNTSLGKGTVEGFIRNYKELCE